MSQGKQPRHHLKKIHRESSQTQIEGIELLIHVGIRERRGKPYAVCGVCGCKRSLFAIQASRLIIISSTIPI